MYGIGISQSEGVLPKGQTIRKLMGVGGGEGGGGLEEVQKKIFGQQKIKWKKFMHAN